MTKRQFYRSLSLRMDGGKPATLDEETRSVEVLASTENEVQVFDWNRGGVINEILLMSGLEMPENRQVILLDTHSRYSTHSVIGSFRDMTIVNSELIGRAHFSTVPEADSQYTKVREGHLTDFSVGYRILKNGAIWIEEGESAAIDGRTFEGPLRVVTKWKIKELSVCPIGADEMAKARAEHQEPAPNKKEDFMDKQLRAFLERQGLPEDATEKEAQDFFARMNADDDKSGKRSKPSQQQPPSTTVTVDPEEATRKAIEEERSRTTEIRAMCRKFNCPDLEETLVADGSTVDAARQQVMVKIEARHELDGGNGYRGPIEVQKEDREKFRAATQDALQVRAGFVVDDPAPGADELAGRTMTEISRMALLRSGFPDSGRPIDVIGRALTSTDLPIILGGTANLSLQIGWDTAQETWQIWCATGAVSNFLTHKTARASETSDLDEIPESQEYKYGELSEKHEEYKIATYGKLFAITRQAMINDDIGALTEIPHKHGEAAARKVGDIAYAVLIANSAMGDGKTLFQTAHKNIIAAGAVGEGTLALGIKQMRQQKDIKGNRTLNIPPEYFISPVSLEGSAEVFFASEKFVEGDTAATRANIYSGKRFTRVYESRLDDDSEARWYLAAAKGKTVKVYFLDGVQKPYLEMQNGWSVDGVEHKVRIDAGAKALDWVGLQKNDGA